MRIGVIGINHKLADLKLRELLARTCQRRFSPDASIHANHAFVLLSTCNRTEVYFSSGDLAETHSYILNILNNDVSGDFDQKLYTFFGADCFSHLARVTSGLDSMILAETEIQGQVKAAYEQTMIHQRLPAEMHYLFQKSLKIGKQIRSNFDIHRGLPDIEHILYHQGLELFFSHPKTKVLFLGASMINLKILAYFVRKKEFDITLCNRTQSKTVHYAEKYQIKALPWDLRTQCWQYDWIIVGTKCPELLIRKHSLPLVYCGSPKLFVDLSVPRNIDPEVASIPGVTLYDIDQINRRVASQRLSLNHQLADIEGYISGSIQQLAKRFIVQGVEARISG